MLDFLSYLMKILYDKTAITKKQNIIYNKIGGYFSAIL